MKYDILLFDADETLFDFKQSERIAFEKTCRQSGISYEENYHFKLYKEINTVIWQELAEGRITQKELNQERFRRFLNAVDTLSDAEAFAEAYIDHLSQASILYEGVPELLKSLSESCRLAVVSNGLQKVQDGRIRKNPIAINFEEIVISDEVGILKPDPAIFELTLKKMKCTDRRTVLMVGDSLSTDVQGGINSGIDTCWFNPGKASRPSEIIPTYEISALEELKSILL